MFLLNKYKSKTDSELLKLSRTESKPGASSELFSRYSELIQGLCLKYLSVEDSKDAVMDIYEMWTQKSKEHTITNIKSWFYVLTKNHCLGKIRKEKWQKEKFNQMNIVYSEDFFHPSIKSDNEEKFDKLGKCMELLSASQKLCIQDFYLAKKSYNEIAEERELSWNQIRSFIQNGRRNLKKCIEG